MSIYDTDKLHVLDGNAYLSVKDMSNLTKSCLKETMDFQTWISKNSSECFPKDPHEVIYSCYRIVEKDCDNNFMVTSGQLICCPVSHRLTLIDSKSNISIQLMLVNRGNSNEHNCNSQCHRQSDEKLKKQPLFGNHSPLETSLHNEQGQAGTSFKCRKSTPPSPHRLKQPAQKRMKILESSEISKDIDKVSREEEVEEGRDSDMKRDEGNNNDCGNETSDDNRDSVKGHEMSDNIEAVEVSSDVEDDEDTLTEEMDGDSSHILDISIAVDLDDDDKADGEDSVEKNDEESFIEQSICYRHGDDDDAGDGANGGGVCGSAVVGVVNGDGCSGVIGGGFNGDDTGTGSRDGACSGDGAGSGDGADANDSTTSTPSDDRRETTRRSRARDKANVRSSICDRPFLALGQHLPAYVYIKKFSLVLERFTIAEKGSNPMFELCAVNKSCKAYMLCSIEDIVLNVTPSNPQVDLRYLSQNDVYFYSRIVMDPRINRSFNGKLTFCVYGDIVSYDKNKRPIAVKLQFEKSAVSLHSFMGVGCIYHLKYDSMICAPNVQDKHCLRNFHYQVVISKFQNLRPLPNSCIFKDSPQCYIKDISSDTITCETDNSVSISQNHSETADLVTVSGAVLSKNFRLSKNKSKTLKDDMIMLGIPHGNPYSVEILLRVDNTHQNPHYSTPSDSQLPVADLHRIIVVVPLHMQLFQYPLAMLPGTRIRVNNLMKYKNNSCTYTNRIICPKYTMTSNSSIKLISVPWGSSDQWKEPTNYTDHDLTLYPNVPLICVRREILLLKKDYVFRNRPSIKWINSFSIYFECLKCKIEIEKSSCSVCNTRTKKHFRVKCNASFSIQDGTSVAFTKCYGQHNLRRLLCFHSQQIWQLMLDKAIVKAITFNSPSQYKTSENNNFMDLMYVYCSQNTILRQVDTVLNRYSTANRYNSNSSDNNNSDKLFLQLITIHELKF